MHTGELGGSDPTLSPLQQRPGPWRNNPVSKTPLASLSRVRLATGPLLQGWHCLIIWWCQRRSFTGSSKLQWQLWVGRARCGRATLRVLGKAETRAGGELGAAPCSTLACCVAKSTDLTSVRFPPCWTRDRNLCLSQWVFAVLNWFVLLNSLAINEYKVLKEDALVGKIQLKQSLDRKHVRAENAPSPHSHPQPCTGWLMLYRNAGLFSGLWLVLEHLYGLTVQWGFLLQDGGQPRSQVAPINAAALFQHHADTTDLPIKDVFSCRETTALL